MNHRIHRQRWQVKAPSPQVAFALRQQLRSHLEAELLPVFERAFDALAPGDEVIHITRLTLEVKLHPEALQGNFISALRQTLPEVLHDELGGILRATPSQPDQLETGQTQLFLAAGGQTSTAPPRTGAQRQSASVNLRNNLLHYLSCGQLEWHQRGARDDDTLLQALREAAATLAWDACALRDALVGTLAQRHAASFRLLQLLSADARTAVLASASTVLAKDMPENLPESLRASSGTLLALLRRYASPDFPASRFARSLGSHLLLHAQAMLLALREADLRRPPDALIAGWLRDCQRQAAALTDSDAKQTRLAIKASLVSAPAVVAPPPVADTRPPAERAAPAIGQLADDAGLILLHPFLPRLFEVLNLSAGNRLPDENLPRAAALLHWLVSGREEVYEFELTIIKVLLGLPPNQMLPVAGGLLNEADRIEADALLAAAIAHWAVLGKTGASALRRTFLQRRGLLRDSDSGWQLQLEPAPYDLLLGSLPWSFSLVRLPWMNRPLHTEWPMP